MSLPSSNTLPVLTNNKEYKNFHADLSGYFIFREKLKETYNINHAILNFYQIGQTSLENIILANVVKSISGNIYFTELRIKEQLGYTTKGKIFSEGNYLYYLIVIQGSTATPDKMDLRIENVVELMGKKVVNVNKEKLGKFVKAAAKTIGKPDGNLNKRTYRLWDEIITGRGMFNLEREIAKVNKGITVEKVLEFFDRVFGKKLRKLSIQVNCGEINL